MGEYLERTRMIASRVAVNAVEPISSLDDLRREQEATELMLIGSNSRILATVSDRIAESVSLPVSDEVVMQVRQGHDYVTLEPLAAGLLVRAAVLVPLLVPGAEPRMLQAIYPIERRWANWQIPSNCRISVMPKRRVCASH